MSKCTKELQEIVDYELSTIRDRAEFTICDSCMCELRRFMEEYS